MSSNSATIDLLSLARDRLNKVYNPTMVAETTTKSPYDLSFIQMSSKVGQPPPTFEGGYQKNTEGSNGVLKMIDTLASDARNSIGCCHSLCSSGADCGRAEDNVPMQDIEKEMAVAKTEEADAQEEYEETVKDASLLLLPPLAHCQVLPSTWSLQPLGLALCPRMPQRSVRPTCSSLLGRQQRSLTSRATPVMTSHLAELPLVYLKTHHQCLLRTAAPLQHPFLALEACTMLNLSVTSGLLPHQQASWWRQEGPWWEETATWSHQEVRGRPARGDMNGYCRDGVKQSDTPFPHRHNT